MGELSEQWKQQVQSSAYVPLTILGGTNPYCTELVQSKSTGELLVRKTVPKEILSIYYRLRTMQNRHLAKVVELQEENGYGIIIEEYISGQTLEQHLRKEGILEPWLLQDYMDQLLEVLLLVHAQGVIHRDISPKNILISTDGVLKLLDFGIAREEKDNQSTDTTVLGTIGYAAPEQFGFRQTDPRTDIYAVGVLMNVLLEGVMPNEQLTQAQPFKNAIMKCTQMDPAKRYTDAGQLRKDLQLRKIQMSPQQDKSIIPGFRSGVVWREILAICGYVFLAIGSIGMIVECGTSLQTFLLELCAVLTYVWLPVCVMTNIGRWDRKIPGFSKLEKPVRITLRIVITLVLFYFGILLDNYVRYDLLGFVKK